MKLKYNYINYNLIKKTNTYTITNNTSYTFKRSMTISLLMVNKLIKVHNGRNYKLIKIIPEMIGSKLGEFYMTRARSPIILELKGKRHLNLSQKLKKK